MKIEVGSEWVSDTDSRMEFLVLDARNTDECTVEYEVYNDGHYFGVSESNKSLFLLSKSPIDSLNEDYSDCEFSDEDGQEEEYCFAKELVKVLSGEYADNSDEYNRGYEDGKRRGITLGYNKRDYEKPKGGETGIINSSERKHSHYFKDVRHLDYIDIYQVCKLFEVEDTSHCTHHSIKKLLMSGKRGAKDKLKDIIEARDTLNRYLQIEGIE